MLSPLANGGVASYGSSVMELVSSERTVGSAVRGRGAATSLTRWLSMAWSAAWAVITGLLPHVLHHAGPLAGAALLAGTAGSLLLGGLGLLLAIPFLKRLRTRFGAGPPRARRPRT